jgi:DNA polymerase III subunit delta
MTTSADSASPLGSVTLVTGPEELINDRVVQAARAAVRRVDAEAETSETTGDQLTLAAFGDLAAPSLFATTRCVVVRQLEDVPEETHEPLAGYAAAPEPEIALVLVHSGGQKGTGLLNKLRKLSTVTEHRSEAVKAGAMVQWVQTEARRHKARLEPDAADALVEAVGPNLRALAAAVDQLSHDFPGQPLTHELVARYFSGRADVKGYEIADHALWGRTATAMEELRWALDTGVTGPMITGSFASAVRGLARLKGATRGLREGDLAKEVGVPPWKLRSLRDQARGWDEAGLATAVKAVAAADAEVKGAGADAAYSLERMVLTISGARLER